MPRRPETNPRSYYSHSQDSESIPSQTLQRGISLALRKPRREGPGGSGAAPCDAQLLLGPSPTWIYSSSPSREQAPLGEGVPGAECACLFKRPRGAPCKPPRAGGGGHGRGRLAPGGRGSTTKLRPLSLRIGRAPQTGGGRALSRPSLSQALLGPGVRRARASQPPSRCTRTVRSALPAIRKCGAGGLGRVVPRYRYRAWLGCPSVLGSITFCGVKGHCWELPRVVSCRCCWSV